ncbi:MAG: CBS domain-containing protein [Chloroflexota bacterium]
MNVCDVMTSRPTTVMSDTTIAEALKTMRGLGCHHLPVMSVEKHLIGVISFHDCQRVLGDSLPGMKSPLNSTYSSQMPVSSAMTAAPIIVEPDAPAYEAARLMLEQFIGCLPVMRGETLVGIITCSDLLMAFMHLSQ